MPIIAVAAVAVLLVAAVWVWQTVATGVTAGPLKTATGDTQSGIYLKPKAPMTWAGYNMLVNPTSDTVVIDKVAFPTNTPGLAKKVVVFDPYKYGDTGDNPGWPPQYAPGAPMTPPQGATIQPHHTTDIVVKLVPPGVGVYWAGPITVDYHIGGSHYQMLVHSWIVACTLPDPNGKNQKRCDPPLTQAS